MGKRILSKRRVEIAKSYLDSSGVTQVSVAEQHDVHRGTVQRIAKEQRGIRQALKQVKIERRLFATLAGAIDEIEGEVNDKLAREEQGDDAGFCWYMGYERWKKEENGQREEDPDPHFNAVKPVSDVAATALLKRGRKSEFRSQARSVRDRNPPGKLQDDALSAITGDRPIPDYHFLLSAYQLIYSFRGKISFIEGIVNAAQGQRGFSNWLFWIKYLEEEDELGLPKVNLYDENRNLLFKDRPQSTFRPDGGDKAFAEWMKAEEERDQSEWVACLPIFDGPERSEKTLRGYLNWECKDDERDDLQKALKTLQEERELISSRINRAYWEGVRNYILDSYPAEKESDSRESQIEIEDTLQHWICELRVFFGWEKESSRSSAADPYYVEKDKDVAELPLSPLIEHFARVTVSSESILSANDAKKLRSKPEYNGQSLFLEQQGGGSSGFLKKRVFQAIDLLEDILQKRQTLVQKQKALRSARGAAMAAIMSRNTSHNVGSHVSPRATLERIEKRFEGLLTKGKELFDIAKELKGGLDRYIQEKTDFLAEVTTNPLASTRSARFYQDIILPFVENTLILDNIAANEGLGYEKEGNDEDPLVHRLKKNSLKIRVFIYDEEGEGHELKASYSCKNSRCEHGSFCYPEGLPYSMYCVDCEEPLTLGRVEGAEHDLEIAVPGPLGEHAFYGFLENHIRNAAKHNQQKLKGNGANLEIRIELSELSKPKASDPDREAISDKEAIFYQVRVLDNVSKPEKMVGEEDDVPLYEAINQRIDADIIEEDGSLKRTAWGIAEMKICATLLRGSRDLDRKEALCNEKEGVKSLRAVSTEKGELGYDLYLMKSRKLCAVTPSVSRDQSRKLRKQGIWVFQSVKQLEEELTKGQSAASFELALFDCASEGADLQGMKSLGELMPLLPFRVLVAEGGVNERDLGDVERLAKKRRVHVVEGKPEDWSQPSELLAWAWRNWIKRWGVPSENPVVVNIYLEQSCSESPTREWTQQADTFNETEDVTLRVWENGGECTQQTNADGIQIFYDRHGNGAMAADFDSDYVGKNAGVMLEKLSPDFTSLFNPSFPDVPNQWTFPWKLAEAGLLNVLVVDERIAEQAFERFDDVDALKSTTNYGADSDGPTLWHLAWGANIYICTHFGVDRISSNVLPSVDSVHSGVEAHENSLHFKTAVQLEKRDSTQKKREKRNAGILHKRKMKHAKEGSHVEDGEWMDEEEVPIDMILIHQGVLDTVCEDASFTQNDVLQTLQASVPFVIVESGRGIPHSLENHIKFIPFSRIQQVISDTKPAKLSLAQTGLSLNRKRVNRHE